MRDPLTRTLLILTFVTGIVDVVSFLALGNVFAAMQTGNVIFLGLGVAGESGAPVLAPLVALVAFLVGGTAAALLARAGTRAAGNRLRLAMAAEIGLLGGAAVLAALVDVHPGGLDRLRADRDPLGGDGTAQHDRAGDRRSEPRHHRPQPHAQRLRLSHPDRHRLGE